MHDENNPTPIGAPEAIEPEQGKKIFKRIGSGIFITLGGLLAFATLVVPTRTSGASRSAKLRWQERQNEIQQIAGRTSDAGEKKSTACEEWKRSSKR